jgi:diguanylate cyclase (GGDEF)-like protein/PAS domain S-box-containing protein
MPDPVPVSLDLSQDELALLLRLGEIVVSELDPGVLLELVAQAACEVVRAETLVVPIIDAEHQTLTYLAAHGLHADDLRGLTFSIDEGSCGWVLRHQRPLLFGVGLPFEMNPAARWEPGRASSLLVPLIARGVIIGGLSALGRRDGSAFTGRDLAILTLFANQASIAIENSRLFARLSAEQARLRLVLDSAAEGIYGVDRDGICSFANKSALSMLGYADASELVGRSTHATIHHSDAAGRPLPAAACSVLRAMAEGRACHCADDVMWKRDGTPLEVEYWAVPNGGADGGAVVTFHDIGERKQTEATLKLAASVFVNSYEGILVTDAANRIVDVNPSFTRITGYPRDEVLGQDPKVLASGRQGPAFYANMWQSLFGKGYWAGEIWNRRRGGEVYAQMLSISMVRDDSGQVRNHVAVFTDIDAIKRHEAELERVAHYDALTGVPNRRLLGERLRLAVEQVARVGGFLAVCYLDLDGFKPINDQFGHDTGDQVLIEVTRRLHGPLRATDTVARLGGDEFVILLCNLQHEDEWLGIVERLLGALRQPIVAHGATLAISASIGLTLYPPDDPDPDALLRHADQAMYRAKDAGRNTYHLFDAERDRQIKARRHKRLAVQEALGDAEFELHYQPKVDLVAARLVGAEALLRWRHPELGLLAPGDFLADIAGTALELELGDWVVETALDQLATWQAQGFETVVSVNISAAQLLQPGFATAMREALERHPGIDPALFELEVLETAALHDIDSASRAMAECRALGLRFALDDFGTGYSSLTYFRRLPVDTLKIDKSFVIDMLDDPGDLEIVEGVIRLAQAFNRSVIAEGVESMEHGVLLVQLGCRLGQGFGIARPMPATQLPDWACAWQRDTRPLSTAGTRRGNIDPALSVAAQSHRVWIEQLEQALRAPGRGAAPELDSAQCRFGKWYQGVGARHYGGLAEFRAIAPVHEQVHAQAREMLAQARTGSMDAALGQLPDLLRQRDRLLALLERLIARLGAPDQGAPSVAGSASSKASSGSGRP